MKNNRLENDGRLSPKVNENLILIKKNRDYSSAGKMNSPAGNCSDTKIYFDPPLPYEGRSDMGVEESKDIRYMSNFKSSNKQNMNNVSQKSG